MSKRLTALKSRVTSLEKRAQIKSPEHVLNGQMMRVARLGERLESISQRRMLKAKKQFEILNARLDAANPLSLMSRGYAVVQGESGVVTRAASLSVGDKIRISFADGEVGATVEITEKGE